MAEGRMLKKRISYSDKFAAIKSDKARVLYFMMFPHLDCEGRIEAEPIIIKGTICPYIKNQTIRGISKSLQELHDVKLLILYNIKGKQYLQYTRFEDFNKIDKSREAISVIPAPTPEQLQSNSRGTPPEVKLSKVKLSKDKTTTIVFAHWNSKKQKGNKWKSHNDLSYEIEQSLIEPLKHYPVETLCQTIDNYALVLLSSDYQWSYAWTLYQFFSRSKPTDRTEKQFWRFLPNNFVEDDYLTPQAKQTRIAEKRQSYDAKEAGIIPVTAEEKRELRKKLPVNMQKQLERAKK